MGGENRRELDLLTLNAAVLLPVEMPGRGTPHSPLMLCETPYRQLVPFSPFDASIGDANMLIIAKSGGGKTVMAQLFLLMMERANPQISMIGTGHRRSPRGRQKRRGNGGEKKGLTKSCSMQTRRCGWRAGGFPQTAMDGFGT